MDRILKGGFNEVVAVVEGLDKYAGYQVKVLAKNENYIAQSQDMSSGTPVDGPVLACTPDLICIMDSDTGTLQLCISCAGQIVIPHAQKRSGPQGYIVVSGADWHVSYNIILMHSVLLLMRMPTGDPITTDQIRYGLRIGVVVLPANPMLKTEQALKVVGPKAFGFDVPYREPRPLCQ